MDGSLHFNDRINRKYGEERWGRALEDIVVCKMYRADGSWAHISFSHNLKPFLTEKYK